MILNVDFINTFAQDRIDVVFAVAQEADSATLLRLLFHLFSSVDSRDHLWHPIAVERPLLNVAFLAVRCATKLAIVHLFRRFKFEIARPAHSRLLAATDWLPHEQDGITVRVQVDSVLYDELA